MRYDDLRILKEMKQKGIITEEEFEKRKEKLTTMSSKMVYHVEPNHKQEMITLHNVSLLNHHIALNHPYEPLTYNHSNKNTYHIGTKSKKVAGFLAIFLGAFGMHNFYLSHHGKAIAQLLITILCISFTGYGGKFFMHFPVIWGAVEGIMILLGAIHADAHNIELK